ncbi:phage tail tape measure protein [Ewingella americana]|uniref:Phage tail tape measure protein n=1 Tax=Ewingella americana TaxID=41202 RepID=A0A502FWA4_9GAMM|nr:phage tail tape measure protein [Ewingella americana]TPG53336.1 phage tail tape measure protein [Ewingella americana]
MSNFEQIPATLGKIIQQLQPLKNATSDVWKRFTQSPPRTLFSRMSEDIDRTAEELQGLGKGSQVLDKLSAARSQLAVNGPALLRRPKPAESSSQQPFAGNRPHPESQKQQGSDIGQQYRARAQKIDQLKNTSSSMVAFAQPKLELAKNIFQPGADLQKGLSEMQAKLGLKNSDPRLAALRQQTLSMANSGHSPADVLTQQSNLAANGLNADQILAQTPAALNGATPVAQTEVRVKGDNLDGDITKLFATWDTIRINLFDGQSAALRELTQTATGWLTTLNTWITDNPQLVNSLMTVALGITGLVGGLGFLGTVIAPVLSGVNMLMAAAGLLGGVFTSTGGVIAAAFAAIGLPLLPVIALIAGIGIAVVKLWDPISAFVSGMIEGFSSVMGPVSDAFAPFQTALTWITDLFAPIKFSKDELNGYSEIGKNVGEALAAIFVTLNKAVAQIGEVFNWARKGIDSVLNFFSDDSNEPPAQQNTSVDFGNSMTPSGGVLSLYQPAKVNAANTLADNRATTVNLSFTATPETDQQQVQKWISEAIDQHDSNKTTAQLSQFGFGGYYS